MTEESTEMSLQCEIQTERWELAEPFTIARGTVTDIPNIVVSLRDAQGLTGRGEAVGVPYRGETTDSMTAQIESVRDRLQADLSTTALLQLLPAGGARNALDCALWDLHAQRVGLRAWQIAGFGDVAPVTTAYTIGIGSEADTRRRARAARHLPLLKIKADATHHLDVVRIVKEEHPTARLVVDANQGWNRGLLEQLLPALRIYGVELVEQPVPRGEDAQLDGLSPVIPLAADESCTDRSSLPGLLDRYQYLNIKLDKSGGLTEGLALAAEARRLGFGLMVGCMGGTSLGMAPAWVLAQQCRYVDLDAPLLMRVDRPGGMRYEGAQLQAPERGFWG
jgi:L-alanine-DL-glutamate epimerase-like enolase superfamily enzyme